MSTGETNVVATKRKRPWFRLHFCTIFVLLPVAAAVFLADVPGNHRMPLNDGPESIDADLADVLRHGWPWTYLRRQQSGKWTEPPPFPKLEEGVSLSWGYTITLEPVGPELGRWSLTDRVVTFNLSALAADLGIGLLITSAVAFLCEWWRRSREKLWQFHLREALTFVFLFAVLFAWLGVKRCQCQETARIIANLEALDASVGVECGVPDWFLELFDHEWLNRLQRVSTVEFTSYIVGNAKVGDEDLNLLKGLNLRKLDLESTAVTDGGLACLKPMNSLEWLRLARTQISDGGLARLKDLNKLRYLDLTETQVTDDGLLHLRDLTKLEELNLTGTQVSNDAVARIKQGLPHLRVAQ